MLEITVLRICPATDPTKQRFDGLVVQPPVRSELRKKNNKHFKKYTVLSNYFLQT